MELQANNQAQSPDTLSENEMLYDIFSISQKLYDEINSQDANLGQNHIKIYQLLTELGKVLVHSDRASFWRWDKRAHRIITNAQVGADQIIIDEGTGLVGKALLEGRAIVTNDPYNSPYFNSSVDKATGYVTKSILVMPIKNCHGDIIGAYQAINKLDKQGGDEAFDLDRDCKRLSLAALVCGLTLESDLFLDDSQRDKLTDVKNRIGFHSDFDSQYMPYLTTPVPEEEQKPMLSIIMCDIDFFKKVNDTYGHNAGDEVLRSVAKTLEKSVRAGDNVYRWGGEEFIIMLKGADVDIAAGVAERIRGKIEATPVYFAHTEIRITMSFGCAQASPELTVEQNIETADERLYRAKETGRNRVIKD